MARLDDLLELDSRPEPQEVDGDQYVKIDIGDFNIDWPSMELNVPFNTGWYITTGIDVTNTSWSFTPMASGSLNFTMNAFDNGTLSRESFLNIANA